jgi:lysophospholipase L1-like esterase
VRVPRVLVASAVSSLALVTVLTSAAVGSVSRAPAANLLVAAAQPVRYVALGDSYSAGTGAGPYAPAARTCERSSNAFPQLWASRYHPASFVSVACAGATTATVRTSQLSALSDRTTLVSITIGGNDVGFTSVMETCVLQLNGSCERAVATAESSVRQKLPAQLDQTLRAIRDRAPLARIVVLGYPDLYDLAQSPACLGIGTAKRTALNGGAAVLDQVLRAAAARRGDTFADVRREFARHEICDGGASYLNALAFPLDSSYHPNAAGPQHGYLPAFSAAKN